MLSWRLHLKIKRTREATCFPNCHQESEKLEVRLTIYNTVKGEWTHIQNVSTTAKASQLFTNMFLVK